MAHWSGEQLGDMPRERVWRYVFVLTGAFQAMVIWYFTK